MFIILDAQAILYPVPMTEVLGLLAGALTTISFLPQLLRILKTKSTEDISLWMYLVFVSGVALWLVYGFLIDSIPVIAANSVTILLAGWILVKKIRPG